MAVANNVSCDCLCLFVIAVAECLSRLSSQESGVDCTEKDRLYLDSDQLLRITSEYIEHTKNLEFPHTSLEDLAFHVLGLSGEDELSQEDTPVPDIILMQDGLIAQGEAILQAGDRTQVAKNVEGVPEGALVESLDAIESYLDESLQLIVEDSPGFAQVEADAEQAHGIDASEQPVTAAIQAKHDHAKETEDEKEGEDEVRWADEEKGETDVWTEEDGEITVPSEVLKSASWRAALLSMFIAGNFPVKLPSSLVAFLKD